MTTSGCQCCTMYTELLRKAKGPSVVFLSRPWVTLSCSSFSFYISLFPWDAYIVQEDKGPETCHHSVVKAFSALPIGSVTRIAFSFKKISSLKLSYLTMWRTASLPHCRAKIFGKRQLKIERFYLAPSLRVRSSVGWRRQEY